MANNRFQWDLGVRVMKRSVLSAFALLLSLSAAHASSASEIQDPLQALDLNPSMEYATAKTALLASGWVVEQPSAQGAASFPAAPEIECGSGVNAICSVGFSKGSEAFGLVVEQRGTSVVVTGAY